MNKSRLLGAVYLMNNWIRVSLIVIALAIAFPVSTQASVSGLLVGLENFERGRGEPLTETRIFSIPDAAAVLLRVYNGGPPDSDAATYMPVSSAEIHVAGQLVLSPHDFMRKERVLERELELPAGVHELKVRLTSEPGSRIFLELVTEPPLRLPRPEVQLAAEQLYNELPGVRLTFGQRTGHVIGVQALNLVDNPTEGFPEPLSESRGTSEDALSSAMLEFFTRFGSLWELDDPVAELHIAHRSNRQYDNVGITDPSSKDSLSNLPVSSLELVHLHNGIRVLGRYTQGLFDDKGNLQALTMNLLPVPKGLNPVPGVDPKTLFDLLLDQLPGILDSYPSLFWLTDLQRSLEEVRELVWLPQTRSGDGPLVLAWDLRVRDGLNAARFWIDANTGNVLRAIDDTPSAWFDDGMVSIELAPDEAGDLRRFPSTLFDDTWYMGYGEPFGQGAGPFFRPGERLNVADTLTASDRTRVPSTPLSISAAGNNDWASDPGFIGQTRAAVAMADNVSKAFDNWARFGWQSWDGRGSTFWTAVNGNKRGDGRPHFNAYGGGGGIHTMDGLSPDGHTYSSSLEIIGHELMHSIITATTSLQYLDESGAINEALSDFFGSVLTGIADDYNNDTFGEFDSGAGNGLRNMVDPTSGGQPNRYSAYVNTSSDSGGVHTNSGILNRAHSLMVQEQVSWRDPPLGLELTAEILRAANKFRVFPSEVGMEEYATTIRDYCRYIEVFGGALGRSWPDSRCRIVNRAFFETELFSVQRDTFTGVDDISVESSRWAKVGHPGRLRVILRNKNPSRSIIADDIQNIVLTSETGEIATGIIDTRFNTMSCRSTLSPNIIRPGTNACVKVFFSPSTIAGYLTGFRNFTLEVFLNNGDAYTGDNHLPVRIGPDYSLDHATLRDTGSGARISGAGYHGIGGFPAGLRGVYLTRNGNEGPLTIMGKPFELTENSSPRCIRTVSGGCLAEADNGFLEINNLPITDPDTVLPLIHLPTATQIPGEFYLPREVWADDQGRLFTGSSETQIFLLIDAGDLAEETNETNNLLCVNCVPSIPDSSSVIESGVIVRLPLGTDTDALFPLAYRNAARKLPTKFPRDYEPLTVTIPDLGGPIVPLPPPPLPGL